jgi:hypothetical protein
MRNKGNCSTFVACMTAKAYELCAVLCTLLESADVDQLRLYEGMQWIEHATSLDNQRAIGRRGGGHVRRTLRTSRGAGPCGDGRERRASRRASRRARGAIRRATDLACVILAWAHLPPGGETLGVQYTSADS